MVEYSFSLDNIFGSLADPTRRDILMRLRDEDMTVGQIAIIYDQTLAAVSKHLQVLERARLVIKRKRGKERVVSLSPEAFAAANEYLEQYGRQLQARFDRLENYLNEENNNG